MSSIVGAGGSAAPPMSSERARIICDPNRIRLTADAVFVSGQLLDVAFLNDWNWFRIRAATQ